MAGFIERAVFTFECPRCGYVHTRKYDTPPKLCTGCGYPDKDWGGSGYVYLKDKNRMEFEVTWLDLDRMYRK